MQHALWFEARGVQEYILASGRVKDIVGASELVDQLTAPNGILDMACQTLGINADKPTTTDGFSRRAGGAFVYISQDAAQIEQLAALWSMLMPAVAPQLEFVLAKGQGSTPFMAAGAAGNAARVMRNRGPIYLPEAGPFTRRAQKTGLPAAATDKKEWIDAGSVAKRAFYDGDAIARKFPLPNGGVWPKNLEPLRGRNISEGAGFPYLNGNKQLAIVHVDGNGFGLLLRKVNEEIQKKPDSYIATYRAFSELIAKVTNAAVQKAIDAVIVPKLAQVAVAPMRPLLLGGDDLTVLIRPDLAFDFVQVFAREFERASADELISFQKQFGFSLGITKLTVGAGVVVQGANQPFYQGYELAESLCGHAKSLAGKQLKNGLKPSTVSFYRLTTSGVPDWEQELERNLTVPESANQHFRLTAETYGLVDDEYLVPITSLKNLAKVLQQSAGTRARHLLTLMQQNLDGAKEEYKRWQSILQRKSTELDGVSRREQKALKEFRDALRVFGEVDESLPIVQLGNGQRFSPLADAIALNAFGVAYAEEESEQ